MSLNIYRSKEEIPDNMQYIDYNDLFFAGVSLKNDAITSKILLEIDKAAYNSPLTFIGRDESLGALNKENLSTGCKTLLNIISNPDKCFSVEECGQNCLAMLSYITEGNILWKLPVLHCILDDRPCDIKIDNKVFNNFDDFVEYIMN